MGHIFISHSTVDAREAETVCRALEAGGLDCWIAPRDVPMGASYPKAIINAVRTCGAAVVLVSESSNRSQHVIREVERIAATTAPFIILRIDDVELSEELEYFASLTQWFDAFDGDVGRYTDDLVQHLRSVLRSSTDPQPSASSAHQGSPVPRIGKEEVAEALSFSDLADRQRKMLGAFGTAVIEFICCRPNPSDPLPRRELLRELSKSLPEVFGGLNYRQFSTLLEDAKASGNVPGLSETALGVFVVEENIAVKLERNRNLKENLARYCVDMLGTEASMGMDGGSTTLPIAEGVCEGLEDGSFDRVHLITNSLSVAQVLNTLMVNQGWTDDNCPATVYLAGGVIRPNTHATAWQPTDGVRWDMGEVLGDTDKPLDYVFLGANGFHPIGGLTMGSDRELAFKRRLMNLSSRVFFVADVSKAGIQLPVQIATWEEDFVILTNPLPGRIRHEFEDLIALGRVIEVDA